MLSRLIFSLVLVLMFASFAEPAPAQGLRNSAPLNTGVDVYDNSPRNQLMRKNGFVVHVKSDGDSEDPAPNGTVDAEVITVTTLRGNANFPNLEELLRFGGTIELSLNIGEKGSSNHTIVSDTEAPAGIVDDPNTNFNEVNLASQKAISDAVLAQFKHRLVISEIMWGLDGSDDSKQWIEIYNNGDALKGRDDLRLRFYFNRRVNNLGKTYTQEYDNGFTEERLVIDMVSLINRFGSRWDPPGSSGRTIASEDGRHPVENLVSMYRKTDILFGWRYKDNAAFGDGSEADSWEASVGRTNMDGPFVGTPGTVHKPYVGTAFRYDKTPASIPAEGVIINEFRNDTSAANIDWVELHNNTDTDISIRGWQLRVFGERKLNGGIYIGSPIGAQFPDENLAKIPAGGYLLIVNRHPSETPLAGGIDITNSDDFPHGATHQFYVDSRLNLPNTGKYLLYLRKRDSSSDSFADKIVDFAGNRRTSWGSTDLAPLVGWEAPSGENLDPIFQGTLASSSKSYGRDAQKSRTDYRLHQEDWKEFGSESGGLGYDPGVDLAIAPGTPGYPNDAVKGNIADVTGSVVISEIMYDAGPRARLVQWIELYNTSMTTAANLDGWKLELRNGGEGDVSSVDAAFTFDAAKRNTVILPNQTLLLVSDRSSASDVPNNRVYNLYRNHRDALGLKNRGSTLLSTEGFYLKLTDKDGKFVDEAGNVMLDGPRRILQWTLPEVNGDKRYSILRQFGNRQFDGNADAADPGTMQSAWRAAQSALTYYGHRDDVGSPGHRVGSALPVSLSSFHPVRDKGTGAVVITWTTESELNNAGFNILRSETKNGAFQVINVKGIIAGHGTTSEKHVYTYTDTTAKPNVVYYYQIEDVSLDGKRTTLATTHLREDVSAGGKLTTRWSELKSFGK
ncbi:MAG: lamin tail domain-containing protein [Candidatus Poribacteria bacterium]|nr:lamin tail domain-containing protein [Candidatus Poribacteria bacterium]